MTAPGRLRASAIALGFVAGGFPLAVVLYVVGAGFLWGGSVPGPLEAAALQTVCTLVVFGALTWLVGFRALGLDAGDLRWVPGGRIGLARAAGAALLGAGLATATMVAAVPLADAGWTADGGSAADWGRTGLTMAAVLVPAAFAEELVFRGVPLVLLAAAFGRATAVVATAGLFSLAHLLNPEVTALGLGNIALAGVFLGTAFYLPGGLWAATGAHVGWNLTLALLAAPVSGLPLAVPGIDYDGGGPGWLSGGAFGPEGGLLATMVLAAGTLLVARRIGGTSDGAEHT